MRPAIRHAAGSLLLASCLRAEGVKDDTALLFTPFYKCEKPATVVCIVNDPDHMKRCQRCEQWGLVQPVYKELADVLDPAKYAAFQKNANLFLKEILTGLYGLKPEHADRFVPHKIARLYERPEKYGWIVLDEPKAGAIMIDRRKAALVLPTPPEREWTKRVLEELEHSTRPPLTVKTLPEVVRYLLYPSDRKNQLWSETTGALFKGSREGKPKAIFPAVMFTDESSKRPTVKLAKFSAVDTRPEMSSPLPPPGRVIPLHWNLWTEEEAEGPTYKPVAYLKPGQSYNVALHLAPFAYEAVYNTTATSDVRRRLAAMAKRADARDRKLTIVAIAENERLGFTRQTFEAEVRYDRFSAYSASPSAPFPGDPLQYLRQPNARPTFVFSEARMPVKVGSREGKTWIALSIWDADGIPIDEVSVGLCVASSMENWISRCGGEMQRTEREKGLDFARLVSDRTVDGALHLIETPNNAVVGVFHRGGAAGAPYDVWRVSNDGGELVRELRSVANRFGSAYLQRAAEISPLLAQQGKRLHDLLFPGTDDARIAERDFQAFTEKSFVNPPKAAADAKTLYLRFLLPPPSDGGIRRAPLFPLGVLNMGTEEAPRFLGFNFRIESPLGQQLQDPSPPCISRWKLFVPSATGFKTARDRLIERLPMWFKQTYLEDNFNEFRKWMTLDQEDEQPTAMVVLSHYNDEDHALLIDDKPLTPDEIKRRFSAPAIAVLNGCGTAKPGSEKLIQRLNELGVDAVIAARSEVVKDLAVDFFDCLAPELSDVGAGSPRRLGDAYFNAVLCLRDRPAGGGVSYGARALAYGLSGNAEMSLCQPTRSKE